MRASQCVLRLGFGGAEGAHASSPSETAQGCTHTVLVGHWGEAGLRLVLWAAAASGHLGGGGLLPPHLSSRLELWLQLELGDWTQLFSTRAGEVAQW